MSLPLATPELRSVSERHRGVGYLNPTELSVHDSLPQRVALIGSCLLSAWNIQGRHKSVCTFDVFTVNHGANLPKDPPDCAPSEYDFQIIQIPLRLVMPDAITWKLPYNDLASYESAFEDCCKRLQLQLQSRMVWNTAHGVASFVTNFPTPQRNPWGVLFPRFDLRNPEYFVSRLNERMETLVRAYENAYILDLDRICASFGRRYVQDDTISTISHGSIIGLTGPVTTRIEPMAHVMDHYEITWPHFFADAVWTEALCIFRVLRQIDAVKLIIVDLDDTLWHGVSGDTDDVTFDGWAAGLEEALFYLKRRGILLAIASKNEEDQIRDLWPKVFGKRLSMSDFAAVKINWRRKAENVQEILSEVNLLPRNTIFIDDNPAERAAMLHAFPDMRVLGRYPYYFKRILLWSPETQGTIVSNESERRTEMIQAQIGREIMRVGTTREDFLTEAAPKVRISLIEAVSDERFPRTFELLNKTNQFNTTGKRWTQQAISAFFHDGGRALVFDVADAFTDYGLVGVVLLRSSEILQWVMSCRVIGYDVEQAVMSVLQRHYAHLLNEKTLSGVLVKTDANFPCRSLYKTCGFVQDGDRWILPAGATLRTPPHIAVLNEAEFLDVLQCAQNEK